MSIMDYFRTTNMGILPMDELPSTFNLNKKFFAFSLGIQVMFMLLFIGSFGFSIYRVVKKIKDPKFKLGKENNDLEESEKQKEDQEEEENQKDSSAGKQTNDNLIYRFDQDDHEKEKKSEAHDKQKGEDDKEKASEKSDDDYDKDHDEYEDKFLQIDNNFVFLMPFLVGQIICNNLFALSILSLALALGTVILYLVFNVKQVFSNVRWLSLLFMIPALGSFAPFFLSDYKMLV